MDDKNARRILLRTEYVESIGAIPLSLARMHCEFYRVLLDARATNSSNLESKSFRAGDWFDFL